jgi:hypothetical protein
MSDKQVIKHAIERSKSHNEIVRVEIQDGLSLEGILFELVEDDFGFSDEARNELGQEVIDAYGDDWRIQVTCLNMSEVL